MAHQAQAHCSFSGRTSVPVYQSLFTNKRHQRNGQAPPRTVDQLIARLNTRAGTTSQKQAQVLCPPERYASQLFQDARVLSCGCHGCLLRSCLHLLLCALFQCWWNAVCLVVALTIVPCLTVPDADAILECRAAVAERADTSQIPSQPLSTYSSRHRPQVLDWLETCIRDAVKNLDEAPFLQLFIAGEQGRAERSERHNVTSTVVQTPQVSALLAELLRL